MKKSLSLLFLICLLGSSCGPLDPCSSPESFVKSHTTFVEDVIENAGDLSENEWKEKDKEFEKLMEDCFEKLEDDLSSNEKEKIVTNSAKYVAKRVKNSLGFSLEGLADNIGKVINEDTAEDLGDIGKDFGKQMEKLFDDDMKEKMENLFDEDFKEKLDDLFDENFKNKIEDIFNEEFQEDLKGAFEDLGKGLEEFGEKLKEVLEESSNK